MVSLGNSNRNQGGGYFFNSDVSQTFDETDEASLVSSVLAAEEESHFRTIPITGVIIAEILFVLGLFTSAFVLPHYTPDACFILNCLHVGVWSLLFIANSYLHHQHGVIQRYGYLEFHRKTQILQKIPFITTSWGNTVLLVCAVLLQKYCTYPEDCLSNSNMKCYNYVQIFISVEFFILLPCLMRYLVLVIKFNRSKAGPDVHQDELLVSYMQSHAPVNEIGFRDEDYVEEILEKQADMIRYLKQHNAHLARKILKLTMQLNSVQNSTNRF